MKRERERVTFSRGRHFDSQSHMPKYLYTPPCWCFRYFDENQHNFYTFFINFFLPFSFRFLDRQAHQFLRIQNIKPDGILNIFWVNVSIDQIVIIFNWLLNLLYLVLMCNSFLEKVIFDIFVLFSKNSIKYRIAVEYLPKYYHEFLIFVFFFPWHEY